VLVSLATAGYMRRDPATDAPASTPNAIPDTPARANSRMQLPFRIVGEDRAFASLKEAIEAAGPGMKIELLDEGPFDTPELTIAADSLTIAAAAGLSSRPVLAIQPQDAELPGLMASGALTLEGIELRLERPMSDLVEEPARDHSATVRALGNLTIRNCRIVTTASRTCVSVVGGELRVQRSHLETAEGVCVWWRPRFADAARVEDCLLQGEVAMTVWCPSNNADSQGLTLDFERNCVAAKTVIQQVIDMPPNQQLTLNARQNTLAADSILTMSMVRLFPALRNVGRSETGFRMLLERLLQVTEQQNVYSSQMQGVRRAMLSRENSLASPIATLAQWHAIWGDGIKLPTIAEVTVPTDATKPWTIAPVDGSAKRVATPLR
jgi:hypothetical protein